MNSKAHAAIGFASRAGKLISGDFAVKEAISLGKASIVIIDESASDNTKEKWKNTCSYYDAKYVLLEGIALVSGKTSSKVFSFSDSAFAKMFSEALDKEHNTDK